MNPLFVFEAEGGEDTESVKGTLKKTGKTMINTGKLKMYGMEELGL